MATETRGAADASDSCAVCGLRASKQCARCKMVKYCSANCQRNHWNSEHKTKCKDIQPFNRANSTKLTSLRERQVSLVPASGSSKILKKSNKILFMYEEFIKFFNWDKPGYPPCGLLNCGNSCFANAVLQCLVYTRPLVAYLLEKGHRIECKMEDWCFLCEFQTHVERTSQSVSAFSPMNILSRLQNIGGNLGYGEQEDAHEFMRFAIDRMQAACLDEFGGEKVVHPSYQQTTLIQHIFGGRLQSQVICTKCNNVSSQIENMMDLTVEIHGDAETLEECLDQFTAKEWLHGDNMYKCDGCNAYVMAWKRLSVQHAPNILTIALKRFQSGRFGKLNKRITFPKKLNLRSYMSELEDGNDYQLYAVIVHVDMLNASFFGHYICYVKDFRGNWYRIDDDKVDTVDPNEVLSQGAYMLLYSRIHARPSCLLPDELLNKQENDDVKTRVDPSASHPTGCISATGCLDSPVDSQHLSSANCSVVKVSFESLINNAKENARGEGEVKATSYEASLPTTNGELQKVEDLQVAPKQVDSPAKHTVEPTIASSSVINSCSGELDSNISVSSNISTIMENASHGNTSDAEDGSLGIWTEESTSAKESNTSETSSIVVSEVPEVSSVKTTSNRDKPEHENGSLSPDDVAKRAAKSSNEKGSSGVKLKPVFVPGFLGKQPRKTPKMQQLQLNNDKNEEVVRPPTLLPEHSGLVKDDETHSFVVLETGESAVHKCLQNGDLQSSNCIQCKYQNSNNKRNAAGSRATKPCC